MTIVKLLLIGALSIGMLTSAASAEPREGVGFSANALLDMCKSKVALENITCFTYVAGVRDAYIYMAITSLKDPRQTRTQIAGICAPTSVELNLPELLLSAEKLVQEWRAKVEGMDAMGEMNAGGVILASIRQKYPCPK